MLVPVLQTTPYLHDLCGESSMVLSLEPDSYLGPTKTPLPPNSPTSVLAHSSEALFANELYGLLAGLEAVSPECGKEIFCILAGKA
jgi:hypothetical protein